MIERKQRILFPGATRTASIGEKIVERAWTMIAGRPSEILRQLEEHRTPDRELLARFVRERDQVAFAEIVCSHGPIVLGVCRRVTGHSQDAEDAFQAVFLILARKAAVIGNPDLLGNWLYGVAVRVAQKARRSASRRRVREVAVNAMPDIPTSLTETVPELSPILDEELAALPSWYRDAIILCDLRGVSRQEAAATLGVPEGTLSSRLANGRKKLAARLTKRGIALSVAAIPTTIATAPAAVVPAELLTKTCTLVADWMAGGAIPRPLIKLTEGGMTMRKILMLGMLTTAVAIAGVYAAQPGQNPRPTDPHKQPVVVGKREVTEQPAPDAKAGDKPVEYTSDPKLKRAYNIGLTDLRIICWNPNGTKLAVAGIEPERGGIATMKSRIAIHIISFDPPKTSVLYPGEEEQLIGFTPDGSVVTELREYQLVSGFHRITVWESEPEKKGVATCYKIARKVDLTSMETLGYAFATDGKTFRTVAIERDAPTGLESKLDVQEVDFTSGKPIKSLLKVDSKTPLLAHALSSDGKRLAVMESQEKLVVYDVDRAAKLSSSTLKREKLNVPSLKGEPVFSVFLEFSPNGRKLVVSRGIGQTVLVNTDDGSELPGLEGAGTLRIFSNPNTFSGNGRLLALNVGQYAPVDISPAGGKGDRGPSRVDISPAEGGGGKGPLFYQGRSLIVWDTETGSALKTWKLQQEKKPHGKIALAFDPVRPLLAILEPNGDATRLGLWDFSAEVAEKK